MQTNRQNPQMLIVKYQTTTSVYEAISFEVIPTDFVDLFS
jgi:hypothetical protein